MNSVHSIYRWFFRAYSTASITKILSTSPLLLVLLAIVLFGTAYGREIADTKNVSASWVSLSASLPDSTDYTSADSIVSPESSFYIAPTKRLSDAEIREKVHGWYATGLPEIETNPINGIGGGGNFFLYYNGTPEDPFFNYTPYRQRYTGSFKVFETGKWQGAINMDFPYLFDSQWRMRIDAVFEEDPNFQYFGYGVNTMQPLSFVNKRSGRREIFSRMDPYLENLAIVRAGNSAIGEAAKVTDRHYNELHYNETLLNILVEKVLFGGELRVMFGYELLFIGIRDYFNLPAEEAFDEDGNELPNIVNGRTRLTEDFLGITPGSPWQRLNVGGYRGGREGILAFALIYDTRDFEPDPTRGVFLEYSHEHSRPWLGSEFSFDKNMIQAEFFQQLFPELPVRLVFAACASLGYIWGDKVPFYEAFDLSSQAEAGGTEVLGGARSLRGFREYRFTGPLTALVNLELRARLLNFNVLNQQIGIGLVPFFDIGRVWDRLSDFNFQDYRYNFGVGGRIAWNQATILRFDVGISSESTQFFFGFAHIF